MKVMVFFPAQYQNAAGWRLCTVDRFGTWRGPGGMYMPTPKPNQGEF